MGGLVGTVAPILAFLFWAFYYFFIKRAVAASGLFDVSDIKTKTVMLVFSACLGYLSCSFFSVGAVFALHIIVFAGVVALVDLIVKAIGRSDYKHGKAGYGVWKRIVCSGIVPILVSAVLVFYGVFNMHNVVRTDYTVYTQKSIRQDGYTVALIADVHYGVSVDKDELISICTEISKAKPDIVALCGDIVDEYTTLAGMKEVFAALGGIESEFGTYYVYGNHDRQEYTDERTFSEEQLKATIEQNGITILSDEACEINDELVIVGREDKSYKENGGRKSIAKLLDGVDKSKFVLTLDHQPKQYAENGKAGTDLLLSGHTHGGQIWPMNYIFEMFGLNDSLYGYTRINKRAQAVVTSGLAGWGFPIKTAGAAEYAIVKILPDSAK
ncbi:MAG: metallophosphoesterase family protein [Clostridiales bacterium]|nr:metallophosphoesterase family protein [Clostridiales bacterium]